MINRLSRREGVAVRRTAFNLRDDNRWPDKWENRVGAVARPSFPFWNREPPPLETYEGGGGGLDRTERYRN